MLLLAGCAVKHPTRQPRQGKVMFSERLRRLPHAGPRQQQRHHRPQSRRRVPSGRDRRRQEHVDPGPGRLLDPVSQHPGRDARGASSRARTPRTSPPTSPPSRPGRGRTPARWRRRRRPGNDARGRQAGVHRHRWLRELPHAGRRRDAPAPWGPTSIRICKTNCATAQSKQIRGATLAQCIQHRDHQALRLPPVGLQGGRDALELRADCSSPTRSRRSSTSWRRRQSRRSGGGCPFAQPVPQLLAAARRHRPRGTAPVELQPVL